MSPSPALGGRCFTFKVEIELHPSFALGGAELAEALSDGLIALDAAGLLFPGLSTPGVGERLTAVSLQATGFRRGSLQTESDRTHQAMMGRGPTSADGRPGELSDASIRLGVAILRLRMLRARLDALAEDLLDATAASLGPEHSKAVQTALDAAARLIVTTDDVLNPMFGEPTTWPHNPRKFVSR